MADEHVSDDPDDLVTDQTRAEEQQEEAVQGRDAGPPPTAEEEAAADRSRGAAEGVEDSYREMTGKGAEVKGEGEVG